LTASVSSAKRGIAREMIRQGHLTLETTSRADLETLGALAGDGTEDEVGHNGIHLVQDRQDCFLEELLGPAVRGSTKRGFCRGVLHVASGGATVLRVDEESRGREN
jgi:hypothetical protein